MLIGIGISIGIGVETVPAPPTLHTEVETKPADQRPSIREIHSRSPLGKRLGDTKKLNANSDTDSDTDSDPDECGLALVNPRGVSCPGCIHAT